VIVYRFSLEFSPVQIDVGFMPKGSKMDKELDANFPLLESKRPITKHELAAWTGFSIRFIDKEVKVGRLRKLFSGVGSRFTPQDVQDWMDSHASIKRRNKVGGDL
jgi:hypothetical protein